MSTVEQVNGQKPGSEALSITDSDCSAAAGIVLDAERLVDDYRGRLVTDFLPEVNTNIDLGLDSVFEGLFDTWDAQRRFVHGQVTSTAQLAVKTSRDAFLYPSGGTGCLDQVHERARLMKLVLSQVYSVPVTEFTDPQDKQFSAWEQLINQGADSEDDLNNEAETLRLYCQQAHNFGRLYRKNGSLAPLFCKQVQVDRSRERDCFDLVLRLVYAGDLNLRAHQFEHTDNAHNLLAIYLEQEVTDWVVEYLVGQAEQPTV